VKLINSWSLGQRVWGRQLGTPYSLRQGVPSRQAKRGGRLFLLSH